MPVTLPIEVYEAFEKSFGKEDAHKVVKSLEATISDVTDYRWKVTKDELLDSIRKEFVTRELFEERMKVIEEWIKTLENKMDERFKTLETKMDERFHGVDGKFLAMDERFKTIDERFKSLNFKLNIFLAIAFIALTFANPTFVKLLERLLKF